MDYSKERFERLYKDSYRAMYRLAYSLLENQEDARDAVSQVFMHVWQTKPQMDDASALGYLLAATRNLCISELRQKQKRMEAEAPEAAAEVSTEQDAERQELLAELRKAIDENLSPQDRRVLELHYEEEMTYAETGRKLGISAAAVNKHITRSLSKLRLLLGGKASDRNSSKSSNHKSLNHK